MSDLQFIGSKENRIFSRLPWNLLVTPLEEEKFELIDFSPGGVGLSTKGKLRKEQILKFKIDLSENSSTPTLICKIIWAKKKVDSTWVGPASLTHQLKINI